jgi:cytochrome c biogenesis protein CcdA
MIASLSLAFLAGVFSTLSPCVLPLLPVILGTAVSQSKFGPAALAAGLALSFVAIGLFVALAGQSIGLEVSYVRTFGGLILMAIGLAMSVPAFSASVAASASPVASWADARFGGFDASGLSGQFALGLLLGVVWSPCVGPTLGAASVLAAQGKDLVQVATTMGLFGIGAALPLLLLGLLSREAMIRWRNRLMGAGSGGKIVLGAVLIVIGALVVTGLDKQLEAALVAASPDWLTELTTRF